MAISADKKVAHATMGMMNHNLPDKDAATRLGGGGVIAYVSSAGGGVFRLRILRMLRRHSQIIRQTAPAKISSWGE